MKLSALFLLLSGWIVALAAATLLPSASWQAAFVLGGAAVEAVGLTLLFRSHMPARQPPSEWAGAHGGALG
jgi:hypothetical protein